LLNYIWGIMIVLSVICGFLTGKIGDVSNALITGADDGVKMTISLMGVMCFWSGIMNIAEKSGVTEIIAKILKPVTKILFPKLKDEKAINAIIMNMTANMLGLSNAATPLGLKAMKELNKYSDGKTATDEMCMFIVINTASLQIIPATIIAMRQAAGSATPTDIIIPVWLCSICVITVGVVTAKIFSKRQKC